MTIRVANGYILLDVSKEAIVECFDLDRSAATKINKNMLEADYYSKKKLYRGKILPLYMKKMYKGSRSYLFDFERESFELNIFEDYFVRTYYALC